MKPIEEVIDVVGDFGPVPAKQESLFPAEENFDVSFDVSAIQSDSQQMQMQEQALMMPPHLGNFEKIFIFSFSSFHINFAGQDDNDSQQAAEAMIQLGYYSTSQPAHHDESLDFDPNYDPSDFLIKKDSTAAQPEPIQQLYQEPYEYASNIPEGAVGDELQQQSYYGSFAPQAFNANDFGFQQPQQMSQEDYSQPQLQAQPQIMIPSDGGGLADLEISDSDDEGDQAEEMNTSQVPADTSKDDDDGLWF